MNKPIKFFKLQYFHREICWIQQNYESYYSIFDNEDSALDNKEYYKLLQLDNNIVYKCNVSTFQEPNNVDIDLADYKSYDHCFFYIRADTFEDALKTFRKFLKESK